MGSLRCAGHSLHWLPSPIFHAIATCGGGNAYTLPHLAQRYARAIDLSVRATFRIYGKPHPNPVTPLEYAQESAQSADSWCKASAEEVLLLKAMHHPA